MSQTSQPDTTGGLPELPIDVLLNVFDGCDVADILSVASTCKELRTATEERHVWLTQFKRCCTPFRQAPFHSRTKDLNMYSTAQLKLWTIQQARTDALWLQNGGNLGFQSVRINDPEDVQYEAILLLPGGEHLVVLTRRKDIILKKIVRENDFGDSGWVLADVASCSILNLEPPECPVKIFTDTVCEFPLITYHNWADISIAIFRLDYDSRAISVQKNIQVDPDNMLMDYQIEYLGIRGDTVMWFYTDGGDEPRMNLIVAKLDDPDNVATRCFDFGWNVWVPGASHFEVLTANAFIRYDQGGIYLYHIPHLPSGIQSRGENNRPPTPSIVWSYCDDIFGGFGGLYYNRADAVLPNLCLHDGEGSHIIEFGMNALVGAERGPPVGYPVVLNHTVTSGKSHTLGGMSFQGAKGRKEACFGFGSPGEFFLNTALLDDPDRRGRFRGSLRQHGLQGACHEWTRAMEYDEVTGRIILLVDGLVTYDLFLADLPRL